MVLHNDICKTFIVEWHYIWVSFFCFADIILYDRTIIMFKFKYWHFHFNIQFFFLLKGKI